MLFLPFFPTLPLERTFHPTSHASFTNTTLLEQSYKIAFSCPSSPLVRFLTVVYQYHLYLPLKLNSPTSIQSV